MKKTLFLLLLCSGFTFGATTLTYTSDWAGAELTSKLTDAESAAITSEGNAEYDLDFNATSVSFSVDSALFFNQIFSSASVSNYTINFGTEGSITAATNYNGWGGAIRFTQYATVTINVDFDDTQLSTLGEGDVYTRSIITTPVSAGDGVNGMWNVLDNLTFNVSGLDDYEYVGAVNDATTLTAGQYGYMAPSGDALQLVVSKAASVPEPATTSLSLLGLAALMIRRRR